MKWEHDNIQKGSGGGKKGDWKDAVQKKKKTWKFKIWKIFKDTMENLEGEVEVSESRGKIGK